MWTKESHGFSFVELLVVMVLTGAAVVFLLNAIPDGVRVMNTSAQAHILYYFAKEKMAEIKAQHVWVQNVDTQAPTYGSATYDLANQWELQMDQDQRNYSSAVRGQVSVTLLRADYTPFIAWDFTYTPRERFSIRVTLTQGTSQSQIDTILTVVPKQEVILGVLHILRRALLLYAEVNGTYPASGQLNLLVPNYLPYIPNDPYTTQAGIFSTGTEEVGDYVYTLNGPVREIYAASHHKDQYPSLVLAW